MLKELLYRVKVLFRKSRLDREMDEEVLYHLERETEAYIRKGMTPQDARHQAHRAFGNPLLAKEQARINRSFYSLETIWQDLRFSARSLLKHRSFALIVLTIVSLSIGANTVVFSVVNGLLIKALPYSDSDQLVMLWQDDTRKNDREGLVSFANFEDWRTRNHVFQSMAAFPGFSVKSNHGGGGSSTDVGDSNQPQGANVTTDFFRVMGVKPLLGRDFTADDGVPGLEEVVVISYGLWQRQFGADPKAVGNTLLLRNSKHTIIGVMPAGFDYPERAEFWTPLRVTPAMKTGFRVNVAFAVVGRLLPGVTVGQAREEMKALAGQLRTEYPRENEGVGINVVSLQDQVIGNVKQQLVLLWLAVIFVLLIACTNVANLMLSRSSARRKEMAVRLALGASRVRILRLLLCEGLMLATVGGALGLLIARWCLQLIQSSSPSFLPRIEEIRPDASVVLYTVAASLLTGILFSLTPALSALQVNLNHTLKSGSSRGVMSGDATRLRHGLIVGEIAITFILLVASALMIKSFIAAQRVQLGFAPENLLTMSVSVPQAKYKYGPALTGCYSQIEERLNALPGVQSVGASTSILMDPLEKVPIAVEGEGDQLPDMKADLPINEVSTGYFQAMGISLLRGRRFGEQDLAGESGVAIINQRAAERFWPGMDAVGRRFKFNDPSFPSPWFTVIGIVANTHRYGPEQEAGIEAYLPGYEHTMNLAIRTGVENSVLSSVISRELKAVDPEITVSKIKTMDEQLGGMIEMRRYSTVVLGVFALISLLVAALGIYGVISYLVESRTPEIGIRLALGAPPSHITKVVLGQALMLTFAGLGLGVIGALAAARFVQAQLFGVSATDPVTFTAIMVIFAGTTFLASLIPVRRAQRVDPLITLRYE